MSVWRCMYICRADLDHAGKMSLQFRLENGQRFTGPMEDKVRQVGGGVAVGRRGNDNKVIC